MSENNDKMMNDRIINKNTRVSAVMLNDERIIALL